MFRSCRNRHCPQCQSGARDAWRQAQFADLLPVPYCHLVFTLPHALNPLAQAHPRWVYRTIMQCTAATLSEFAANPQWLGATGAFTLVLHTWTQDLHLHIVSVRRRPLDGVSAHHQDARPRGMRPPVATEFR